MKLMGTLMPTVSVKLWMLSQHHPHLEAVAWPPLICSAASLDPGPAELTMDSTPHA